MTYEKKNTWLSCFPTQFHISLALEQQKKNQIPKKTESHAPYISKWLLINLQYMDSLVNHGVLKDFLVKNIK